MNAVEGAKLARLKRDISLGIKDLDDGRFRTYSASDSTRLADEISRSGRSRLKTLRLNGAAKLQNKK